MIFTLSMTAASVVFLGGPCCQNHVWIVAFYAGSSGLEELNLFGNDLYMAIVNWAAAPIALIKLLQYYSPDDRGSSPMINMHLETSDGTTGELDPAKLEITGLKHRLASATAENEVLHAKYSAALQEADTANEHNKEHSALIKVHKLHDNQAPAHLEKLEEQFTTLRLRWIPCTT
ncbi:hypothetical protein OIU79_008748 [Salix purpurea]|uniref:Uncharacterized protein n=1 Tax=Salix purpurea TaxID=77065 RepID=A0A9Q0TJ43_SALPP|nr:hypothetical protein OIU79_008748 [Salix purpurea]